MVRRVPSKQRNAIVRHEDDHNALKRLGLLLAGGFVLACGFVYAGGQHFAALRLGYQTEKRARGTKAWAAAPASSADRSTERTH